MSIGGNLYLSHLASAYDRVRRRRGRKEPNGNVQEPNGNTIEANERVIPDNIGNSQQSAVFPDYEMSPYDRERLTSAARKTLQGGGQFNQRRRDDRFSHNHGPRNKKKRHEHRPIATDKFYTPPKEQIYRPPQVPADAPQQDDETLRRALIDQIDRIDHIKREVRGDIHRAHSEARNRRMQLDATWLRNAKQKIEKLSAERSDVRNRINEVNTRLKIKRNAKGPRPDMLIAQAFMQVARMKLPIELYKELVAEADALRRSENEPGLDLPPDDQPVASQEDDLSNEEASHTEQAAQAPQCPADNSLPQDSEARQEQDSGA